MSLPTEPGPYWWRAKDGDEWELVTVEKCYGQCRSASARNPYPKPVKDIGGQWAKAHNPDEGQEAFAVRCPNGQFTYISTEDDCDRQCEHLNETDMFLDGQEYDVVPVTIYRKEKE